ncbi:MAG: hypothetical protein ACHQ9S_07090 [Candidatus Binatia bacterium]
MTGSARVSLGRDRARLTGIFAGLVVVVSAYFSLPPGIRNWDNRVKLQVALNIVRGEGPVLTQNTPDDRAYVLQGKAGRYYAGYPPFAYALHFLTIGFPAAQGGLAEGIPTLALLGLLSWLLVAWGLRSGAAPPAAAAGAMLVCLGTALWPMTARGDDNLIEVLGLAAILWAGTGEERPRAWLWAGLAVGTAFATRLGSVILAIPAVLLLLGQRPRRVRSILGRGLSFVLGSMPGIALVLWYNHLRFGSPFITRSETDLGAVGQLFVPWFSTYHWEAMAGLTISPGKGVLWYSPPLVGVVLLAAPLARRHCAAFAALGVYAVAGLMFFGRLTFWHSDWAWGPRYVAPLCLAAAPLGWWLWQQLAQRGRLAKTIAAAGLFLLMALQTIPVTSYPVETYFLSTLRELEHSDRLVTRPITRPPVPADNRILYFHLETSPIVSLARAFATSLRDPVLARPYCAALARAMLAPAAALAFVLMTAMLQRRRPRGAPAVANMEPRRFRSTHG